MLLAMGNGVLSCCVGSLKSLLAITRIQRRARIVLQTQLASSQPRNHITFHESSEVIRKGILSGHLSGRPTTTSKGR